MQGAEDEVEEAFNKAIRESQQRKGRILELRATVSVCRLWQSQGKTAEARERLEEQYSWYSEGFDTRDMLEARQLHEVLSHEAPMYRK